MNELITMLIDLILALVYSLPFFGIGALLGWLYASIEDRRRP